MWLFRYRRPIPVAGHDVECIIRSGMKQVESTLWIDGVAVATDVTNVMEGDTRNHRLAATLPDGRRLDVESGYISLWSVGIAARIDGGPAYESHPGKTIAWPMGPVADPATARRNAEQWTRNKPSLYADIALGILFFAVAKLTDLTTAALVGAAAGLGLVVVQRFVKVDLLGGLALFGVVMLLISAGFSLAFQDPWAVQMRTSILGVITAAIFLTDAAFGGRWLGPRMARYLMQFDPDPRRLMVGMGVVGIIMATANWVVVELASEDTWLFYTTFGDIVLAMSLFFVMLKFVRRPAAA
jgi:intracellular septation protein A